MANKVELYNNGTLIGTDNAPTVNGLNWTYSIPYTADSGNDVLTAKAFVDDVEVASSGVRNVVVNAGGGGGVDPDYQAVLDYATANSIPLPDSTQQVIDNQFMIDYKASGGWAKDDFMFKFTGTASPTFKLICWKRKIQAVTGGTVTWGVNGAIGSSTGFINTLYTPSTDSVHFTPSSGSMMYKLHETGVTGDKYILGAIETGKLIQVSPSDSSDNIISYAHPAILDFPDMRDTSNVVMINKTGGTSLKVKIGTTEADRTVTTTVFPEVPIYLLARNRPSVGTIGDSHSSGAVMSFAAFGASKLTEYGAINNLFN